MSDNLLSSHDVAAALEVTPDRVRQLARQYRVGRIIAGGRIFTVADVDVLRQRTDGRGRPRRSVDETPTSA